MWGTINRSDNGLDQGRVGKWKLDVWIHSILGKLSGLVSKSIIIIGKDYMFYKRTECRIPLHLGILIMWNLFIRRQFVYTKLNYMEKDTSRIEIFGNIYIISNHLGE